MRKTIEKNQSNIQIQIQIQIQNGVVNVKYDDYDKNIPHTGYRSEKIPQQNIVLSLLQNADQIRIYKKRKQKQLKLQEIVHLILRWYE